MVVADSDIFERLKTHLYKRSEAGFAARSLTRHSALLTSALLVALLVDLPSSFAAEDCSANAAYGSTCNNMVKRPSEFGPRSGGGQSGGSGYSGSNNNAALMLGAASIFLGFLATMVDEENRRTRGNADGGRADYVETEWYRRYQAELAVKSRALDQQTKELQDFVVGSRRRSGNPADAQCRGYPQTAVGIGTCYADIVKTLGTQLAECDSRGCQLALNRAKTAATCMSSSGATNASVNEIAKHCMAASADAVGANPALTTRLPCPQKPTTREEISNCYQNIRSEMLLNADTCSASAKALSRPGAVSISGIDPGQRHSFDSCADLNTRGAMYAECVSTGIRRPGAQYNPLVRDCGKQAGFVDGNQVVTGLTAEPSGIGGSPGVSPEQRGGPSGLQQPRSGISGTTRDNNSTGPSRAQSAR